MPAKNDPGPSVKDKETYEALREDGASKQKAARIANAQANDSIDHDSRKLEDRTKDELYEEAQEIGIEGRSDMTKDELIEAIRNS
ncbi:Rho termination factor N-terminal domain-containing protein [Novosphingopyxis sp. YJ-S2-01]|uniref:Rho termination factor N-terminal domain-containing protein n=1 Tax=Novosphingopyxis sp. YJ-S2-01 TaxID=2794021 RepID=UPI0018DEBB25|nr:Rho termination factor N-terminal domain-containing protein [Novosphingopyxis sp. YJ-S2-01]MBH9538264.1 Rho termination factor N-terminal domain-containing protein [Novosphingopyxis sp. YJ-S2-01]